MLQLSSRQLLHASKSVTTKPPSQLKLTFQNTRLASNLVSSRFSSRVPTVYRSPVLSLAASPLQQQWIRYSSMKPPGSGPPVGPPKQANPNVSSTSTTRSAFDEVGDDVGDIVDHARSGSHETVRDVPMQNALVADLKTIKETFALREVPKEAFVLGFAGLIPYVTTSLTTVFCAWDVNYAQHNGAGFLISHDTAAQILAFLEPLQIGYGAVILSFLGAIHWGLEWAGYGGKQGYPRYAIGVVAPMIAWPTVFFSYEYALITQFLGFTYLYYADATAATRGWTPHWYGTYRFVLTFVVGASIVLSLIGRGEVGDIMERKQMGIQTVANPGKTLKIRGEEQGEIARDEYEMKKAKVMDKIEEAKQAERKQKEEEEAKKKKSEKKGKKKDEKKDAEDDEENEESKDEESEDDGGEESEDEGKKDSKK